MTVNTPILPKNKSQNLLPSYGGARRERVLRGRVALIAGASSQRLPLSRLLWVLSCSATRKCPAGGTAQEHGKVFVLGNFLWFSCEGREGALHHETGHVKAAISPLRFATVEMTLFYLNTNLPFRTDDCPAQFRAAPVLTVSPSEPKRIGSGPCPSNTNLSFCRIQRSAGCFLYFPAIPVLSRKSLRN